MADVHPVTNVTTDVPHTSSVQDYSRLNALIAEASQMTRARLGVGLQTYYLPVIIVIGLVGNTLSLLVMLQPHNRRISCCVYMAALAVSDNLLLFGLAYWRISDYRPDENGHIQVVDCIVLCYWNLTFSSTGVCLVICMTIDRFLAVRFPLHSYRLCSTKRAKVMIAVITVAMFVYNLPYIFYSDVLNGKVCAGLAIITPFSRAYSFVSIALNSVVAFVILLGLNSVIIFTICTREQAFQKRADILSQAATSNATPPAGNTGSSSSQDINAVLMLLPVSFALLVLTLPFYTRVILYLIVDQSSSADAYATYLFLYHFTNKLWYTNNVINFFMYCIGGRKFRQDMHKLFCKRNG